MAARSIPELTKKPAPEVGYLCPIHGDIGLKVHRFRIVAASSTTRTLCLACMADYLGTLPIAQMTE
jgi:hypothetical protein